MVSCLSPDYSDMLLLLPMSCLCSFLTASDPLLFFLSLPKKIQHMYLVTLCCHSFLEEENAKTVLKITLCGRLSLPNCMPGIGKQKMLRKFEQASHFCFAILWIGASDYCCLEAPGCWQILHNLRSAFFWLLFGLVSFCNSPCFFLKLEVPVDF